MVGPILIVVALLVIPPLVLMTGMAVAAVIGETTVKDAEARHEGSELIALNR